MPIFNKNIRIYFQVRFMYVSKVIAVQTQGRGDMDQWIESFRLEYSQDCATFNSLLNGNGYNHVRNILIFLWPLYAYDSHL